jgi:hypothetical protein
MELMIFLLNRGLFMRLDIARLIGIGIGLTAPVLLVNAFAVAGFEESAANKEEERAEGVWWGLSAFITIGLISIISLFGYAYHLRLYKALWILFWTELGLVTLASIISLSRPEHPANKT